MTLEIILEELQILCGAQIHNDFLKLHRVLADHSRDINLIGLEVIPTIDACHGSSQ